VTLICNGKVRRTGTAAAALDHSLVPLTWLANELSRTGIGLRAGQMASTGTLTGMLAPKPGETSSRISVPSAWLRSSSPDVASGTSRLARRFHSPVSRAWDVAIPST
jgi:hypothetical protein